MIEIDDRVTIRDDHDAIAAACGYNPACYEDIGVRRYTVETATMGFSFAVNEGGCCGACVRAETISGRRGYPLAEESIRVRKEGENE